MKKKVAPTKVRRSKPSLHLAELEKQAAAKGITPLTEDGLDRFLADHQQVWPDSHEIDDFVAWIRQSRQE